MPWLTPEELPEGGLCRSLSIPDSTEWLAIVSGALLDLTQRWNWQQQGAVTVDEAVDAMKLMVSNYYDGCALCTTPGGLRVLRINPDTGHVEELGDNGEWQEPTGDYAVEPIIPREGGTVDEQKCLAAMNAVNVLSQVYENITDSIAGELGALAAFLALIDLVVALIPGLGIGIAAALAAFFLSVFSVVYSVVQTFAGDLWTADFTKTLTCMFLECATNIDGVVTFDWQCIQTKLASPDNPFDLDFDQLRLIGQLAFIVMTIGGNDALEHAGETTAITTPDCDDCTPGWCITCDFTLSDGGFDTFFGEDYGVYSPGVGWIATDTSIGADRTIIEGQAQLGGTFHVTSASMIYDSVYSECSDAGSSGTGIGYGTGGNGFEFTNTSGSQDIETGTDLFWELISEHDVDTISFENQVAFQCHGGSSTIKRYTLQGTGEKPVIYGWVDC